MSPRAGNCEESHVDASVFPANSHGNAFRKWMNNVCFERISLTNVCIYSFVRACCGRAWMEPALSSLRQAEFGFLALRLFH